MYSLHDKYLQEIFGNFPIFQDVLKVRALRRHHYLRKLKDQQQHLVQFHVQTKGKDKEAIEKMMDEMHQALLTHKKARLIEDKMSYEDLAVMQNFDEDEVTFALNR